MKPEPHVPVMLYEVLEHLAVDDKKVYVDCTFGAGGYSKAILQKADCKLIAFDRDSIAAGFAKAFKQEFGERFIFRKSAFSRLAEELTEIGINFVDGVVFDLGVSSMQLDEHERGFSFDSSSRLDMRMDNRQELNAYVVVNSMSEEELAKIIYEFGDEPKSRQIARKIAFLRKSKPIESCAELARIVRSFYPKNRKTDPATKTFQAIRIFVNHELEELKEALLACKKVLKPGGKLVVVSFHSLEDRIIKRFLKAESGEKEGVSRYEAVFVEPDLEKNFEISSRQVVCASETEIIKNPRARSAKLRSATRICP